MVSRLASGLGKLPAEVLTMTFPQVNDLYDYWREVPPANELLAMLAKIYTTWRPIPKTKEDAHVAHMKSLEERWKAGYLNIKQMFEISRGKPFGHGSLAGMGTAIKPPAP